MSNKRKMDPSDEIKIRIEKARATFICMRKLLCSHDLTLSLRIKMIKCYVFLVFLYGVESWTLTEDTLKCIKSFEMWIYRRMLRISWTNKITNDEVLRTVIKETEHTQTIKKRKLEYFGTSCAIQRSMIYCISLCRERSIAREVQESVERLGSKISDNGLDKQQYNSFEQL